MKAVVLQRDCRLAVEEVPEPGLKEPGDALVRVTTATICGSDIHIKHGQIPGIAPGTVIGHEFVGVVEAVGAEVTRFRRGDRVAAAATTWCGTCTPCRRGEVQHCTRGGVWAGGELFGRGLAGCQAERIRVAFADNCLTPIPDHVSDEQVVFVGDVFGTGFHAAAEGNIRAGDTVVVFGCGPIGLGALVSAWQFGPKQVFAVDRLDNRLSLAAQYGATLLDARAGNVLERLREATQGEGVDVAIEAVGHPDTFGLATRSVRRGGTVSVVGLFPSPVELPIHELVFYGVRISMGLANLSRMDRLMGLLESGRVDLSPLATHSFALADALEAYELFEHGKDRCLKILLKP
jgi:alcohol dehydrogenase